MNNLDDKEIKVVSEPHPGSEKPNDTMMETDVNVNRSDRKTAEIEALKLQVRRQEQEISDLKEQATVLETSPTSKKRRYGSIGEEMNLVLIEESSNKDIVIENLTREIALLKGKSIGQPAENRDASDVKHEKDQEIERLKQQVLELTNKLNERVVSEDLKTQSNQMKPSQETPSVKLEKLEETLAKREAELEEAREKLAVPDWSDRVPDDTLQYPEIFNKMTSLIEEKMQVMEKKFDAMEKKMEVKSTEDAKKVTLSFSDAVSKNLNQNIVNNVIQESKNTDRIIESERNKREKNVMIHGVPEVRDQTSSDQDYVKSLMKILGLNIEPENICRIGKNSEANATHSRPIKLTMTSVEHKDMVMSRLVNLKTAEDRYRRISVKEDYTYEERELVRQWKKKVDEKNKAQNTTDWRLRGDPKNGLRLVKVNKETYVRTE